MRLTRHAQGLSRKAAGSKNILELSSQDLSDIDLCLINRKCVTVSHMAKENSILC